jgi:hypothetical protein
LLAQPDEADRFVKLWARVGVNSYGNQSQNDKDNNQWEPTVKQPKVEAPIHRLMLCFDQNTLLLLHLTSPRFLVETCFALSICIPTLWAETHSLLIQRANSRSLFSP